MDSKKNTEVFCILQNIRNLQDDFDFITFDVDVIPQWENLKSTIKSQLKLQALDDILVSYVKVDNTEYTIANHEDWILVLKMAELEKNQILLKIYPQADSASPDNSCVESSMINIIPEVHQTSSDANNTTNQCNVETYSCAQSTCEENMEIDKISTVLDEKMTGMEERLVKRIFDQINFNKNTTTPVRHSQVTCDNCEGSILGVRYKCGNCPDFDLCERCEAIEPTVHDASHVFLKIKTPLNCHFFRGNPILPFNLYEDVTQKVKKMCRSSRCRDPNDLFLHMTAPPQAFPQLGVHQNGLGGDPCNNFRLFVDDKTGTASLGAGNCDAPLGNRMYDVDLVDCWLQGADGNIQRAAQQNPPMSEQVHGNSTPHSHGDIQQAFHGNSPNSFGDIQQALHQMSLSNGQCHLHSPFNASPNMQNNSNNSNTQQNCSMSPNRTSTEAPCSMPFSMNNCSTNTNSAPNVCTRQPPFTHTCSEPKYPYPCPPNPYFGGGFTKVVADLTHNVLSGLGMTATAGQSLPSQKNSDCDSNKAMMQLLKMGFVNRKRNAELLEKHNNNVERVVDELIREINCKLD